MNRPPRKSDCFQVEYLAADGYIGKHRPLYFSISVGDLEEDMDENDLIDLFEQSMQDHFEQHVHPESMDCDAFVLWARQQLQIRAELDGGAR
jgi:hypothetical protein